MNKFRGVVLITKTLSLLLFLKHTQRKCLKSFVKRYHDEVMEFKAYNHPLALERPRKGLRIDRCWYTVHKQEVKTYEHVCKEVLEDINIEDKILLRQKEDLVGHK